MADQGPELNNSTIGTESSSDSADFNPNCGETQAIADLLSNALKMECICVIRRVRDRIIVRIFEPESEQEREWNNSSMNNAMWV